MASAALPANSEVTFATGRRPHQIRRRFATVKHGTIDAASGDSDGQYVNGIAKPGDKGVPIMFGAGPHSEEGENLYVMFRNSGTTDGHDSDDPANITVIQYADYDKATGRLIGTGGFYDGTAGHNTDVNTGGIPDDGTMLKNIEVPQKAYGPVPPGVRRTYYGHIQYNAQDDTA